MSYRQLVQDDVIIDLLKSINIYKVSLRKLTKQINQTLYLMKIKLEKFLLKDNILFL